MSECTDGRADTMCRWRKAALGERQRVEKLEAERDEAREAAARFKKLWEISRRKREELEKEARKHGRK